MLPRCVACRRLGDDLCCCASLQRSGNAPATLLAADDASGWIGVDAIAQLFGVVDEELGALEGFGGTDMDELGHAVQRAVYTEVDRAADEARRASVRAVPSAEPSQSRCRCGRGEPSPGVDVAGVSPAALCR